MHGFEGVADAEHEFHEFPLREAGVVDEVGVDHVLEVASSVVGEEDVDGLGGAACVANAGDFGG